MTKTQKNRLTRAYANRSKKDKKHMLGFLRTFMPEIIYRTTKLEGESITRKMISVLFK